MTKPLEMQPEPNGSGDKDTQDELRVQEGEGVPPPAPLAPGDEVPSGTAGAAEGICRACGGKKTGADGLPCLICMGTGTVEVGVA